MLPTSCTSFWYCGKGKAGKYSSRLEPFYYNHRPILFSLLYPELLKVFGVAQKELSLNTSFSRFLKKVTLNITWVLVCSLQRIFII